MESLFRCPLCREPLLREEKRYLCPSGHSFDRSAAGYVHLLPANRMHSKDPGDDKDMAAARTRFLSAGYYQPLCDTIAQLALTHAPDASAVLDSGCGEGYYSAALYRALSAGRELRMAGVDLSKHALKKAAKREKAVEFAVGSVYDLPVPDGSVDLLLNCFSPLALEEFQRVLKPGGIYLYVVPGARHLWQLKEVLYEKPYPNEEKRTPYPGFTYLDICPVDAEITLPDGQTIEDLFRMTPYCWRSPRAGQERMHALDSLTTEISFRVHVFRRDS